MKDETWETLNTVCGGGGIGIFITAVLMFLDGRMGLLSGFFFAFLGLLVNGVATVSELMRSEESRDWLREVMNQAMIGNYQKALDLLREGKL